MAHEGSHSYYQAVARLLCSLGWVEGEFLSAHQGTKRFGFMSRYLHSFLWTKGPHFILVGLQGALYQTNGKKLQLGKMLLMSEGEYL